MIEWGVFISDMNVFKIPFLRSFRFVSSVDFSPYLFNFGERERKKKQPTRYEICKTEEREHWIEWNNNTIRFS